MDEIMMEPHSKASSEGHVEVVGMLLAAEANKDKVDNDGWTPLMLLLSKTLGIKGTRPKILNSGRTCP